MGIKCEYCGKFIAYKDFEEGKTSIVMVESPGWYDPPEPAPLCKKCTGENDGN